MQMASNVKKKRISTNVLVKLSMLSALSFMLTYLRIPLPFFPEYLKLDIAELPALISGFAFGPLAGVAVVLVKNLLDVMIKSSTGGVGELSNFIVGSSFVLTASLIYRYNKTKTSAVLGVLFATIVMACVGLLSNKYLIFPMYGLVADWKFLLTFIVPFNLIKGTVNSIVVILVYKHVSMLLKN